MIYQLGLVVGVASTQKAAALRDKVANYLAADPDAELISWSAARHSPTWDIYGVDTTTHLPFEQSLEADSETEARAQVAAPKVIAYLRQRQ